MKSLKKKILVYGINYFPEKVGIGKYNFEMSTWLGQNDFDVKVITANKYFPEWRVEKNNYSKEYIKGVEVIRCPLWVPKNPNGFTRIIHFLSFAITSFLPLARNIFLQPNLIILISPSILFAPSLLFLKLFLSKKIKTWIHVQDFEVDAAFKLKILKGNFLKNLILLLEKKILYQFDILSTISKDMITKAQKKGLDKRKLFLLSNWIDFDSLKRSSNMSEVTRKVKYFRQIFKNKIVLMYSGSMNKKQNFDLLVKCIKSLKDYKNILWVISGEGSSKKKFINAVKDFKNVKIYDLQPTYFLNTWLKFADIHLLPQKKGINDLVLPSKIIGILASGRPVIATTSRESELGKYVSDAGICVENNEYQNFRKAILKLSNNKYLRKKLGNKGYTLSKKFFNKKIILTNLKDQINKLI